MGILLVWLSILRVIVYLCNSERQLCLESDAGRGVETL